MITTVRTTYEGRTYEVVADSDKVDAPMSSYVQVYRIRKDGSRGRHLTSPNHIWPVWVTVRDQVQGPAFDEAAWIDRTFDRWFQGN